MNLFIDTNIFLSFYHLSSDDLEQLRKLTELVREKGITLFLPDQVVNEFRRNRASRIADALKRLRDQKFNIQYPQICREYEEYAIVKDYQKEFQQHFEKLFELVEKDVLAQKLGADLIIAELFSSAVKMPRTAKVLEAARIRDEVGDPPGKNGSLGDALNWETLLQGAPKNEPLFFISDDKDYCSALDAAFFHPFLLDEWKTKKEADLRFYKRLSAFFGEYYPSIKLASEAAKDLLIKQLGESTSFLQTHNIIGKLAVCSEFSRSQVNEIVLSYIMDPQVHLIINDSDVQSFIKNVIRGRQNEIDQENLGKLRDYLALPTEVEEEELPF